MAADESQQPDEQDPPRPVRRRPFRGRRRVRGDSRSTLTLRRIVTVLVIEVAALAGIITCVAALIRDNSTLGFMAGVIAVALIVVAWLLSRPGPGGRTRSRSAPTR